MIPHGRPTLQRAAGASPGERLDERLEGALGPEGVTGIGHHQLRGRGAERLPCRRRAGEGVLVAAIGKM